MNDSTALKSILFLAANPKGTTSLRLQEEEREIKERLRLAGYGKVPINSTGATRPRDIQQAMLDFKPQIVHFSGHGAGQGGLVFEDVTGQEKLVSSEALASLFKLFSNCVECVVLNACYSQVQAEAIAHHINYVVGMNKTISDRAAIEFTAGFYNALGAGESVEFAYELGCNAIQLEGISEDLIPILLRKAQLLRDEIIYATIKTSKSKVKDEGLNEVKFKEFQNFLLSTEVSYIDRTLFYIRRWNDPTYDRRKIFSFAKEIQGKVYHEQNNFISEKLERDNDLRLEVTTLLNFFTELSMLIDYNLVDENLLRSFFEQIVIDYVEIFYPWIQVRRRLSKNGKVYEALIVLYERWKQGSIQFWQKYPNSQGKHI